MKCFCQKLKECATEQLTMKEKIIPLRKKMNKTLGWLKILVWDSYNYTVKYRDDAHNICILI